MDRRQFLAALGGGLASGSAVSLGHAAAPPPGTLPLIDSYVTNIADLRGARPLPEVGGALRLRPVADRAYDPGSILVETADGHPLGYLPPIHGRLIAPLLGAGYAVAGRVESSRTTPRPAVRISITASREATRPA